MKAVRWRRGFVEKITISALDLLEHGLAIFRLAPIPSVRLLDVSQVPLPRSADLGRVIRNLELTPTGSSTFNWRRSGTGSVAGPTADS